LAALSPSRSRRTHVPIRSPTPNGSGLVLAVSRDRLFIGHSLQRRQNLEFHRLLQFLTSFIPFFPTNAPMVPAPQKAAVAATADVPHGNSRIGSSWKLFSLTTASNPAILRA
jgi:hypothetical protein